MREKHWSVASCTPPNKDLACNPVMCPDWELNQRPFSSQDDTQSTEPHQSGLLGTLFFYFLNFIDLLLKRRKRREKERERNINAWLPVTCPPLGTWPTTQACALTGNWFSEILVRRPALNPLSHTSQGHFFIYPMKKHNASGMFTWLIVLKKKKKIRAV